MPFNRALVHDGVSISALALSVLLSIGGRGVTANDSGFGTIHIFQNGPTDGSNPQADLTVDSAGNVYGSTSFGGAFSAGTVFKIAPDGSESLLYSFTGLQDGGYPRGGVIYDEPSGVIFGTAIANGSANCSQCGLIYRLAANGTETVLHEFDGANGSVPTGNLFRDKRGSFYGVTAEGGTDGYGTVYRLAAEGGFTVLHNFTGGDGSDPESGLISDGAGNFYGVTQFGGTNDYGVVYKITRSNRFAVLHFFTNGIDGSNPVGGLTRDRAGNLYGSASHGGRRGDGTIYKIDRKGDFSALHAFTGHGEGAYPYGDLIRIRTTLYGTTAVGGTFHKGTVFAVTESGTVTVLFSFRKEHRTGANPDTGVTKGPGRLLYGTTYNGGLGYGTVYRLSR